MTDTPAFEGFADARAAFFQRLAKNQHRDWFQAHKGEYEEGWQKPMRALLDGLRTGLDRAYPDCDLAEAKVFRLNRDVRFSKDKSPYKTQVSGILMTRSGGTGSGPLDGPAAVYLHVSPDEFMAAAGQYMLQPPSLARFRARLLDDARGSEVQKMVNGLLKKGFTLGAMEQLKKVPKGVDPEHPRAELLKLKGLTVRFPPLPRSLLTRPALAKELLAQAKLAAPLVRWLVYQTL